MAAPIHRLVVGNTLMGKSWWVNLMLEQSMKKGVRVIIYDPLEESEDGTHNSGFGLGEWYKGAWVTSDWGLFSKVFWSNLGCLAVIEESSDVFNNKDYYKDAVRMLKRGRHVRNSCGGHTVILIAQRIVDMNKTARDQCTHLTTFKVDFEDAKMLSRKFAAPELSEAHKLDELEYMTCDHVGNVKRGILRA